MTDHSSHTHPNTKSARAICRRSQSKPVIKLEGANLNDLHEGDRVSFQEMVSYNGYKHCHFGYCFTCRTYECTVPLAEYKLIVGTLHQIIYWADNSVDIEVKTETGGLHRYSAKAPSGDICY